MLELRGIVKRYGGVHALRGVDFDVQSGEVHALVGENGAGKSTLIKIVSGAERADAGTITLNGDQLASASTAAAIDAGIATVYQEPHLFGELTVAENVFLGREVRSGTVLPKWASPVDWTAQRRRVIELLDRLGVDSGIADVRIADLPVAEQQLVSISKAFAQDARILILDEPSAILTDREIEVLFGVVRNLRAGGVGIVYISHRLDELAQISDRVTVLRDGQVVASKPTSQLTVRTVAELMVGHELALTPDRPAREFTGTPVLQVGGLRKLEQFEPFDLDVGEGEVVALYGLVGSGASAIARALYGVDPADGGTVHVDGKRLRLRTPRDASAAGIAMVPGNRAVQGVFAPKSIAFNLSTAHLGFLSYLPGWLDRARERTVARDLIDRLSIRAKGPQTRVAALSGGNQQKTLIARQLVRRPRVLLLEEPTQGVDVGAKDEIHRIVSELAENGSAIVVASSDLPEVLGLADRVLVVRRGKVVAQFGRGARQADVLAAAAGEAA